MSNYPYKLVIFDFDGTLADSFDWFVDVFDHLADRFGFKRLDRENLAALRGMSAMQLIRRQKVAMWKLPLIAASARRHQAARIDTIKPFDGMADVIAGLKAKNIKLAVVTTNSEANVRRVLGEVVGGLIDTYDCGSSLFGKAAKFKRLMRRFKLRPEEILSVGDEIRDIEAARTVGLRTGAASWGYARPDSLKALNPDHMFAVPADILSLSSGD